MVKLLSTNMFKGDKKIVTENTKILPVPARRGNARGGNRGPSWGSKWALAQYYQDEIRF
jgi:hypothetical protein